MITTTIVHHVASTTSTSYRFVGADGWAEMVYVEPYRDTIIRVISDRFGRIVEAG